MKKIVLWLSRDKGLGNRLSVFSDKPMQHSGIWMSKCGIENKEGRFDLPKECDSLFLPKSFGTGGLRPGQCKKMELIEW